MKGLILKDIINLKQQGKLYCLIIAIWLIIAVVSNDAFFFGGVMMIFTVMIPLSAAAYDDKAKWDRYALTMPVSRWDLVLSKYLLALIWACVSAVLSEIVMVVITRDVATSLLATAAFVLVGMTLASLVLPFVFKFGVEKARLIMLALILIPVILTTIFSKMNLKLPEMDQLKGLEVLLPVVMLLLIVGSVVVSKKIYDHKQF